MRKIKIFVDAHVFDGAYQGTTTYIKGIYNELVKNENFEITLAAQDLSKLKGHFTHPGFKFIELPSGSKIKRLVFDIPRIIRIHKFDYAHFQYITPFFKECKYINTIHDLLFLEFPELFPFAYRFTKKYTFRYSTLNSDLICTVSNYSKDALTKYFKIDSQRIAITANAVEKSNSHFVDVKSKYGLEKYILFVSRFEPRKNHLLLLKAFSDLQLYKTHKLVFIGKRNDVKTPELDNYIDQMPEENTKAVLYLENISLDELNCFYKEADLFVYPSFAEGFGIPPLEAAVLGCKVLCSNKTAMVDFDFFGKYLFNPDDYNDFKIKLMEILNDKSYPYNEIKTAVENRYNWEVIAENFAKTLKT